MTRVSWRERLYAFLEEEVPRTHGKMLFRGFMYILISVNILLVVLETSPATAPGIVSASEAVYLFSICIFIALFIIRLWVCVEDPRYQSPVTGRLRYLGSPYALIDLVVIVAFTLPISFLHNPLIYEIIRFLRLSIILKLIRYSDSLQTMSRIFISRRKPLGMALYMLLFLLLITSTVMFLFEHPAQPDKFSSVAESMWWAVETLTTVGYGDIVPITPIGKFFGGIAALLGIAMFAIPAGILASGFYEEYSRGEQKGDSRRAGDSKNAASLCPTCGRPLKPDDLVPREE